MVYPKEEENPLVRIAEALEKISLQLDLMARPPLMVRGFVGDKETTYVYPTTIA